MLFKNKRITFLRTFQMDSYKPVVLIIMEHLSHGRSAPGLIWDFLMFSYTLIFISNAFFQLNLSVA